MSVEGAQMELAMRMMEEKHKEQRASFYEYLKHYHLVENKKPLDENRHMKEICEALEKVYRGETKRLIINVPPRSLKTEITSIAFPAWCMGHNPSLQFMGVSYSAGLAQDASRSCRNMYVSKGYRMCFPRTSPLTKDQDTKMFWKNEAGGHYYATGSSGTIIGKGCDIMIIDDPLKPDDAMSNVVRQGINENYHRTLSSRFNNPPEGAIVIIMQRLHDDDLCGHLLDQELKGTGDKWEKIIIPAIAEHDDDRRKAGESFFEKRFPYELMMKKKQKDAITFATQYQQNPVNKDTQEFHEERFKYHGNQAEEGTYETPANMRIFTACDPAFKTNQHNDNSCVMTAGFKGDKMYILEYSVGKWSADVLLDKLTYHIKKWKPEKTGIEAYQAQSMIVTFLKKKMLELGIHTVIEEISQSGDKLTKIRKLSPLYRDGCIYHKKDMFELESELKRFPRGKHDDIIDAEQMLYDLYALQPNSISNMSINMERDKNGTPIYNGFYQDDRLSNV